jgi:hypothetical protein
MSYLASRVLELLFLESQIHPSRRTGYNARMLRKLSGRILSGEYAR